MGGGVCPKTLNRWGNDTPQDWIGGRMTPYKTGRAGECGRGTKGPDTSWEGYSGPTRDGSGTGALSGPGVARLGCIRPRT